MRLLFCLLLSLAPSLFASTKPPNVLMLVVDDWNDWVGAMGYDQVKTPNIDKLAARGVTFTNAHCPGTYCAPSRTGLMTGMYPSKTGCYSDQFSFVISPEIVDLPRHFRQSGYAVHGGGKLYHHMPGFLDRRGWHSFYVTDPADRTKGWPAASWDEKTALPKDLPLSRIGKALVKRTPGKKPHLPTHYMDFGPIPDSDEPRMADTKRAAWAVDFLQQKHDRPFFLGVGLYAPHKPNFAPQKYFDLYPLADIRLPEWKEDDLDDLPPKLRGACQGNKKWMHDRIIANDAAKAEVQGYLASCSYADAMLGRVLDALNASPYRDNTVVLLWSDNGYHHGEKLRWMKHTLWERTSNVPFIWAGPGIASGQVTDVTASLFDVYPTLVDLCGLPPIDGLDGESLKSALSAPGQAPDRTVLQFASEAGGIAVINRNWRYIKHASGEEELYSLRQDPHEWRNLAQNPEFAAAKARLAKHLPAEFAEAALRRGRYRLICEGDDFRWVLKPDQPKGGSVR